MTLNFSLATSLHISWTLIFAFFFFYLIFLRVWLNTYPRQFHQVKSIPYLHFRSFRSFLLFRLCAILKLIEKFIDREE